MFSDTASEWPERAIIYEGCILGGRNAGAFKKTLYNAAKGRSLIKCAYSFGEERSVRLATKRKICSENGFRVRKRSSFIEFIATNGKFRREIDSRGQTRAGLLLIERKPRLRFGK